MKTKTLLLLLLLLLSLSACAERNPLYCDEQRACDVALQAADGVSPLRPYCNLAQRECHADPQPAPPDLSPEADLAAPPDMTELPDLTDTRDFAPPPPHFDPDIQADVDALGCAQVACHGAGVYAPLLVDHPAPGAAVARMQNWQNFRAEGFGADMGATTALILTKPLANSKGGVAHGGGAAGTKPFASTADPVYQRWLRWLGEGAVY